MKSNTRQLAVTFLTLAAGALAQNPDNPPPFGPGGPGGRGPGGPGGGMRRTETKLLKQFDADKSGMLEAAERKAAREFLAKEKAEGRIRSGPGGGRGPGGRRGGGENQAPPQPGPKLSPAHVKSESRAPLFDPNTLRTLFLEFEDADWEKELVEFHDTDVEVPATLTVDGKTYRDVGVHFRGASSFMMVGDGRKRSLSLSLDLIHDSQRLLGYRTLNLLNSHEDPSFLRTVLYFDIARNYLPAPKANFVRVAINGESWGVYVNAQHFDKDFIKDNFNTEKGARWKVPGSPGARGGLVYLGDRVEDYRKNYELKSKEDPKAWVDLIKLCKVLHETPPDQLEQALAPIFDVEGALKFLALEIALINNDGYWVRTSDYSIYQDTSGKFHLFPHDANETFAIPGGPGFGGGRGGPGRGFGPPPGEGGPGGPPPDPAPRPDQPPGDQSARPQQRPGGGVPELDPLTGINDPGKPLLSKLLAVPALKERYLGYVREIAETWLDWGKLGPIAGRYHALIADEVKADTRKLTSNEVFDNSLTGETATGEERGPGRSISLRNFADKRRAFLLNHPALKKPAP